MEARKEKLTLLVSKSKKKAFLEMLKLFDFVEVETLEQQLNRYIKSAPKKVPLTDKDIMNEVRLSRKNRNKKNA